MKTILLTSIVLFGLFIGLTGCSTPQVNSPTAPIEEAPIPKVQLAPLPEYTALDVAYDTSAICLLVEPTNAQREESLAYHFLADALQQAGYRVFMQDEGPMVSSQVQKVLSIQHAERRFTKLPARKAVAADLFLVVGVSEIKDGLLQPPDTMRSFYASGRHVEIQQDHFTDAVEGSARAAVDNLMTVDRFRRALER